MHGFKDVSDTTDFTRITHITSSKMFSPNLVLLMYQLFHIQGDGFASPEEET